MEVVELNSEPQNSYQQLAAIMEETKSKDVVLSEVNTALDTIADMEKRLENTFRQDFKYLEENRLSAIDVQSAFHDRTSYEGSAIAGWVTWLFVTVVGFASGIGWGLLCLVIVGPLVGVMVNAMVETGKRKDHDQKEDARINRIMRDARSDQGKYEREIERLKAQNAEAFAALRDGRTHIQKSVKRQVRHINQRIGDLKITVNLQGEVTVDEHDPASKGKPLIKWRSENLDIDLGQMNDVLDNDGDVTTIGTAQLLPFYNDGILAELKVYSNSGSLLKDGFATKATLIHHGDIEAEGEFLDQSPRAGDTLNYYLVIETQYFLAQPNTKDRYNLGMHTDEHLIMSKRITVPAFKSEADRLAEEKKSNATQLERMKYRAQYEKTLAKMSGDSADPDQALRDVLQKAETRRAREKQKQDYVAQIEKELSEAGASEAEIEEAIEEFYERLDA